ncbi:cyclic AMP response element-binding protein B isoform X1 [Condylostylus longicornis]|uniref:cyclic AMP response element-binding protein B isoform X1 n=1 Tax=Condylostylus longicornis TaxID=2530218 RepID=UPI00244E3E77|nr:cyclic AMP response element-binding protein B isoform X1 [Condylostylus longicornis]XP_055389531.1 cyclic AMP response element-binding protein B isoform X1 [Condylostylus longicornis]XP_055389532.1 cyclic AMP response element-binding protein B isoform X1 [Condylostylus longicornis]XP_055389533.1 cyclic AMP response element-binding protein B isoform X1 [Condylostylus longicornis]
MDSLVEENGNSSLDPLADTTSTTTTSQSSNSHNNSTVLTTGTNIVQFIPTSSISTQSVIQPNQSSVIQTAANLHPVTLQKGVLYVKQPNTVIQTALGANTVQIKPEPNTHHTFDTNSDESFTDEDSPRRHRDLTRRPSYHKILKDISGGPDIGGQLPIQINESGGISAIAPSGTSTIICQDPSSFYLPNTPGNEDQSRKREIRLQKNREAARECRRKKKEYIKCLENRVAVLENQNKALIDELKSLKELYCQTKND